MDRGEGGRGKEREASKSGSVGSVNAVIVVEAGRVIAVRVDVSGVSRAIRKSPNNTSLPLGGPSTLDAAGPEAPSGAASITLRHGSRDRGRGRAVAWFDKVGDVARGTDDDDGGGAVLAWGGRRS
jgi:hypothetical protein